MLDSLPYYLLCGGLAGLLSGLFGLGGGVVIVPFLIWRLTVDGYAPERVMVVAVATSLATIVPTSISAVRAHHRLGSVSWPWVWRMAPGILVGSALGAVIANGLPAQWLKLLFALFLLYVAGRMLRQSGARGNRPWHPGGIRLSIVGGAIGLLSAMLGIGGGTLSVPFLSRCGHPMAGAVGISATLGFPIALTGAAGYVVLGWGLPDRPPLSLGYVDLPAWGGIVLASVLLAPLGARLAHRLPTARLRKSFALVVLVLGMRMLWQALAQVGL